jgi:hypothetical protein
MNRVFQQSYHIPGTLAANVAIRFTAPFDMQLVHVSAVASNDSDATMTIGTSASAAAYLAACTIGDSGTPVEKARADFVGTQFPHIADGTIVAIALDYDGAGGTAANDVTVVLTFTEG